VKIVARLKSIDEIEYFNQLNVDVFCLDGEFSVKKISFFTLSEIDQINMIIKNLYKQTFVYINKMIHEFDLARLEEYLLALKKIDVSGIVINDMTVYVLAKEIGIEDKIIYQPGSLNTDAFSADYFANRNVLGITLSREITLEEIQYILEKAPKTGLSLIGHGYLDMFYSKRKLLKNYFIHKKISGKEITNNNAYRLNEEIRENQFYPIFEDEFGTHIFRSKKLMSIDELKIIGSKIEYFFIERIFIDDDEYVDSIRLYNGTITKYEFLEKYHDYDKGFYYQRTEKLKGDLDEN